MKRHTGWIVAAVMTLFALHQCSAKRTAEEDLSYEESYLSKCNRNLKELQRENDRLQSDLIDCQSKAKRGKR